MDEKHAEGERMESTKEGGRPKKVDELRPLSLEGAVTIKAEERDCRLGTRRSWGEAEEGLRAEADTDEEDVGADRRSVIGTRWASAERFVGQKRVGYVRTRELFGCGTAADQRLDDGAGERL